MTDIRIGAGFGAIFTQQAQASVSGDFMQTLQQTSFIDSGNFAQPADASAASTEQAYSPALHNAAENAADTYETDTQADAAYALDGYTVKAAEASVPIFVPEAEENLAAFIPAEESTAVFMPAAIQSCKPDMMQLDPEAIDELSALLEQKGQEFSAADETADDIKAQINALIEQAFTELSDPEVKEEDFAKQVLDFLMELMRPMGGGGKKEDDDDDDDDETSDDILLQIIDRMLDEARNNTQAAQVFTFNIAAGIETEAAEDSVLKPVEKLDGIERPDEAQIPDVLIPDPDLPLKAEQTAEIKTTYAESDIEPEQAVTYSAYTEAAPSAESNMQPVQEPELEKPFEQISAEADEAVPQAVSKDNKPETAVRPEEKQEIQPEMQSYYEAAAKTAESIFAQITESVKLAVQPDERAEAFEPAETVTAADELQELTRTVKTVSAFEAKTAAKTDKTDEEDALRITDIEESVPVESAVLTNAKPAAAPQIHAFEAGTTVRQVVTQVANEIISQLPEKDGETAFTMTLNPESLGRITVKLIENAGKLSVAITAERRETGELLAARLDGMQAAMKENGTDLEKFQVVYADYDSKAEQQSYEGSSKNPYVRETEENGEDEDSQFAELLQQVL